jgi:hypothetical protein
MPAAWCKANCNAWNKRKERCNARRSETECQHPDQGEAWKHVDKSKRKAQS